jgi:hypothetical protein
MDGDDKEWRGGAFDHTKTRRERQCLNTYHGKATRLRDESYTLRQQRGEMQKSKITTEHKPIRKQEELHASYK